MIVSRVHDDFQAFPASQADFLLRLQCGQLTGHGLGPCMSLIGKPALILVIPRVLLHKVCLEARAQPYQVAWILNAVQSQQALQSARFRLCQEVMATRHVNFCYSLQACMSTCSKL